jgi:uncharacterized protein (TIGR02391 family)
VLNGDASVYLATVFRSKKDALQKRREIDRKTVSRNMTNFEQAEKVVGYLNMFQPDGEFIAGVAHAWADAVHGAYGVANQPLTQKIIDSEIMPQVEKLLTEESAGVMTREKTRMDLQQQQTRQADLDQSEKLRSLTQYLNNIVRDTAEAIRNEVTIRMIETRKGAPNQKPTAVQPAGEYAYHPEIQRVSQQLFLEGNFRHAVLEAFIHLIATVKEKTGLRFDGDNLMNHAFCPDGRVPPVKFNALNTDGEKDEQRGIWNLFKGIVGMRNYKAHVVAPFDDPQRAHEYLALASLLMRLLDNATIERQV